MRLSPRGSVPAWEEGRVSACVSVYQIWSVGGKGWTFLSLRYDTLCVVYFVCWEGVKADRREIMTAGGKRPVRITVAGTEDPSGKATERSSARKKKGG